MRPVARPSSFSVSKPASSSILNDLGQNEDFRHPSAQSVEDPYAVPDGGIAPVDPLQPGSDVAPVLIQKPSGVDEGNSFCMGQCYANERDAHCSKPYVSMIFEILLFCFEDGLRG